MKWLTVRKEMRELRARNLEAHEEQQRMKVSLVDVPS